MDRMMTAAVLHAPADLRIEKVPIPAISGKEVLIRVKAAGICGSDLSRVMHTGTYTFPTIPGHEFCGIVECVGPDVTGFAEGDRVVVAPILPCFTCESCRQGHYGQCESYNYIGSRTDGAFAEYVKAPAANLIRLPDSIDYEEGAAIEPAAVTLHGMMKAGGCAKDTVAVLGCGTIGLFAIQLARILGACHVIAVDIDTEKLATAHTVGADSLINALDKDVVKTILASTGNKGADVAVETAGVPTTQEQCLRIAKKHGFVLYLGTAHRDVVFPPSSFEKIIRNELTIAGAWNSYSAPFPGSEWHAIIQYILDGRLKVKPLMSHTFKLEELPDAIRNMYERKYPFHKAIVTMD